VSVRVGILSTARINRLVIAPARESDKVEITAVASRDPARAAAYAREWDIPQAYGSYEELLADPEIDAIYNPLPNSMHVGWSIRALEAGKHVLCEKPLSRHPEDVERAFEVAERAGLVLSEAFMYRHNPQTARLVELVRGGAVGEVRVVRAAFSFTITDVANIRLAADLEGGALMDVGCYCLSGSRLIAGEPERLYGRAVWEGGVDTIFAATLEFPGQVFAQFDCGFRLPDRDELEVVGTEGSLFLDDPWHCRRPVIEVRRDGEVEEIALEPVDSYLLELEDLADAIRGAAEPFLGREESVAQARGIDALYRSAESGDPVTL
jgi:D-xylose 1-dehydrogenase (NADP+, D-xylono-1,5-lactone-forming)